MTDIRVDDFDPRDVASVEDGHVALSEEGGFHSQDGLFFRRLDDGRVRVSVVEFAPVRRAIFSTVLAPDVWASIAASVSHRDETFATWDEARRYHMGATASEEVVPHG
jgi:hypothetical protein